MGTVKTATGARAAGFGLMLALLAMGPTTAHAAADDGPSQALKDKAQRDYERAIKLVRAGKAKDALDLFEGALPVKNGTSDIFFNLVQVAEALKRWDKVVVYAQGFLRLEHETSDARTLQAKLDTALKRLEKGGTVPVSYHFDVAPEGVELYVDDVPVTYDGPGDVLLLPGRHAAVARKADHTPWKQTLVVKKGAPETLSVKLEQIMYTGTLKVTTEPADGVKVFIDDKQVATTPLEALQLPTLKVLVRLQKPGYDDWVRYVTIERDQVVTLAATLERTPLAPASSLK